ncbi:hypothetical protein [Asticcacaulis solisilvae]|uniref:hypothetical protein n=1 Tax=Asticcacaulis solisilvae TaxID=1217274 RepID=UPI003FD7C231
MGDDPAPSIGKFFGGLNSLCEQGFLGPLPGVLRNLPVFICVFLALFLLPLAMGKAGVWRRILMGYALYWFGIAIAIGLYGTFFNGHLPEAVGNAAAYALVPYAGIGLTVVICNKGYRAASAALVVANLYVAFFVSFISAMAITGDWI